MKILIDMNLSPQWREILGRNGWESVHWASVGKPAAADETILEYARDNGYVVLTHDLDFSAILAATGAPVVVDESRSKARILPLRSTAS